MQKVRSSIPESFLRSELGFSQPDTVFFFDVLPAKKIDAAERLFCQPKKIDAANRPFAAPKKNRYVNTELRELKEPRLFDYVDFITLDAGERPLLSLIEYLNGKRSAQRLVRTFTRNAQNEVVYTNWQEPDIPFEEVGTPTWDGLPLGKYLSLLDMLNPMNRLWSDGRWNKLTIAHGCYWKKCSFCDVSLDYISPRVRKGSTG